MSTLLNTLPLVAAAILTALVVTLALAGAVQVTSRREHGYVHLIFYAMLLTVAVGSLLSGRDMSTSAQLAATGALPALRHPLLNLLYPLVSVLILVVCAERIVTHWVLRKASQAAPLMLLAFIVFWLSTVASPALFGANPKLSHDYAYALVIGLAASTASALERDQSLRAVRDAVLIFMTLGFLMIPFKASQVMDLSYSQGWLPGLPRLAGLAPHAVSLGLLAQLGLICLLARPYERRWLNRLAWTIGLLTLFMAQSKTAWLAFLLCTGVMLWVRYGPDWWRRMVNPMQPGPAQLVLTGILLAVLILAGVLMFGDVGPQLERFINTPEGVQLTSLTGRDRIWAIAWEEWERNPVFGHGPGIWDERFRTSIGMANATHAHNQFMDTLSRAGTVGAAGLTLYATVLLTMSLRFARATQGLSLGLFLALLLRSISEVPLLMFGYSPDLIIHVLLLMVLASATRQAGATTSRAAPRPASSWRAGAHARP
jgi:O-antigen ligase